MNLLAPLPTDLQAKLDAVRKAAQPAVREFVFNAIEGKHGQPEFPDTLAEIAASHGLTLKDMNMLKLVDNRVSVEAIFEEIPLHFNPNCLRFEF
jgi:hypothetical protein